ncbi:MAG: hypothetical protein ORN26_00760 [Candidatus Pacebacteria bacterium]|nr:hypothetical protein [Candidatus Paceibacterota bacterium]
MLLCNFDGKTSIINITSIPIYGTKFNNNNQAENPASCNLLAVIEICGNNTKRLYTSTIIINPNMLDIIDVVSSPDEL